jgi:hypothetical protein
LEALVRYKRNSQITVKPAATHSSASSRRAHLVCLTEQAVLLKTLVLHSFQTYQETSSNMESKLLLRFVGSRDLESIHQADSLEPEEGSNASQPPAVAIGTTDLL